MYLKLYKKTAFVLGVLLAILIFNACELDDKYPISAPEQYTKDDVKSYADLFKVFWTVMDQRYSCFYEQKRKDGKDWDAIYNEYYPKFSALKTFGRSTDDKNEIDTDKVKAIHYFVDIINPIFDRHFFVKIKIPLNRYQYGIFRFQGGMKEQHANSYMFSSKLGYIKNYLGNDTICQKYTLIPGVKKSDLSITYLMGSVKKNPDIYYLTYDSFSLYLSDLTKFLSSKFLNDNNQNELGLRTRNIENNPLLGRITDLTVRENVKELTRAIQSKWEAFTIAPELNVFRTLCRQFMATEIVSDDLLEAARSALIKYDELPVYYEEETYATVLTPESKPYMDWFISEMEQYIGNERNMNDFETAAMAVIERAPFYQNLLNPLHRGTIKKLILDLRSNGGGAVKDLQFFIERLVTKSTIWSYERTKEGNGRFDYTPWIPQKTKPHKLGGIPSNIPIAILTDNYSASMSEITVLLLKSQGNHVVSIGDYTYGATAGVTSNPADFNGGVVGNIADNWFYFYMPFSAVKDVNGEIIEGVGIKPDIYVAPPTDAEITQMENAPDTFVDRVMEAAVNHLSSK